MCRSRKRLIVTVVFLVFSCMFLHGFSEQGARLPYKFLLVISDQWDDPASYIVEDRNDFQTVVALMKSWGIPFEILRLDQQRLDRYHFLNREGQPRYGTVVWMTNGEVADETGAPLLRALVEELGVNLIVLGNAVATPVVADLAGVQYMSEYRLPYGLTMEKGHFLTRGLEERAKEFLGESGSLNGSKVELQGASAVARRGELPFLTTHVQPNGARVVWIGVERRPAQLDKQLVRDLLKRSLVWAQGYALYAEYPKSVILFMDDFGTSDRTYLPYWHYRTLDEEDIRKGLIEPLKRHNAVLVENIVTGYVDRESKRILNPWKQQVIDELDGETFHDYVSAKKGLEAGLREGVFEIGSHGWTHMLPDLDSPPGPFWDAAMDGIGTLNWYVEFEDPIRGKEVPAILQRYHFERSLEYLEEDFGVRPIFVMAGGGGHSTSYPNHSQRIAAQVGFGLSSDFGTVGYLGRDLVVSLQPIVQRSSWQYDRVVDVREIPWTIDAPYFLIFHDRDVSIDINSVERLLTSLGDGVRYLSAEEYCGYLHTQVERDTEDEDQVSLRILYDDHYCRYFAKNESTWVLHLSDETREGLDGRVPEKKTITIPKGLGPHMVRIGD